jgi:hypothetical protein
MVVNPFEGMQLGARPCARAGAPRGAVLPHGLRPGDAEVRAVILINLLPHREESAPAQAGLLHRPGAAARRGPGDRGVWYLVLQQMTRRPSRRATSSCGRDQEARRADQGHRQPARRDRRAEGAPEGRGRPADRPQHAGAPARRTGQADARGCLPDQPSADGQVCPSTASRRPTSASPSSCATRCTTRPGSSAPSWSRSRPPASPDARAQGPAPAVRVLDAGVDQAPAGAGEGAAARPAPPASAQRPKAS